jgi:serine protease Do
MFKKNSTVVIGYLAFVIAIVVAIALSCAIAEAFPFHWSSEKPASGNRVGFEKIKMTAPNTPEPNETVVPLPSWAPLVKRVMPTVVNVSVVATIKNAEFQGPLENQRDDGNGQNPGDPFAFGPWNFFGQQNPSAPFNFSFGQVPQQFKEHGLGSGVIVSPNGYILTNYHVVEHADRIRVTLMDKREFDARVIGTDAKTDLALIKINVDKPLAYASFGDSSRLQVGDWVIAIGNPFGFNLTVTSGIVSAKGRALGGNYDDYIQTDASINPGNSGGPLFDSDGKLVGINSAIYSQTGSSDGIGFAIPSDLAKSVMDQLREHGHVVRGWLGVEVQAMTPELAHSFGLQNTNGALVADVEKDSPAAAAGIRRGDVIVKLGNQSLSDERQLPEMVAESKIGSTVPIEVIRNGKTKTFDARIAELRGDQLAAANIRKQLSSNWGLNVQKLTPDIAEQLGLANAKGVVVSQVLPDSPSADAGLQRGDVILELDHKKVSSKEQFWTLADQQEKAHKPALLLVERGNGTLFTVINPQG